MSYFKLKNGESLYYWDVGSGDPVVFVHGWTASHLVYAEPVLRLRHKVRCITYDQRGHARSRGANRETVTLETLASDLNELIEGLHLRNVTLLGWSMGAATVMAYLRDYGCGALRQVVLCDMAPRQVNDDGWKLGIGKGAYTAKDIAAEEKKGFFSMYKTFALDSMPELEMLPGFLISRVLKFKLDGCDRGILESLARSMETADLRDVIPKVSVPLTYLYADPGTLFSPKLAEWYRSKATAPFKSIRFPKSTHMFVAVHPDQFTRVLKKLL